jgi:hypothetical protein
MKRSPRIARMRVHSQPWSVRLTLLSLLGILVSTLVMAGCGSSSGGTPPSSGGGGGSGFTPFSSTAIVTNRGTPQAGVVVTLSRGTDATGNPSGVIARVTTDAEGKARFTGLNEGALLCYSASIGSENRLFCSNRGERTVRLTFGAP